MEGEELTDSDGLKENSKTMIKGKQRNKSRPRNNTNKNRCASSVCVCHVRIKTQLCARESQACHVVRTKRHPTSEHSKAFSETLSLFIHPLYPDVGLWHCAVT